MRSRLLRWHCWLITTLLCLGISSAIGAQEQYLSCPVRSVAVSGNVYFSDEQVQALATLNIVIGERLSLTELQEDIDLLYGSGYFSSVSASWQEDHGGMEITFQVIENPICTGIAISGNRSLTAEHCVRFMRTRPGQPVNYRVLEQDIKRLNLLFKDAGYDLSQVSDVYLDRTTGVLFIKINETRIGQIRVSPTERARPILLQREIETKPGDIFNSNALRDDRNRMLRTGLVGTVSAPELSVSTTPNDVNVYFNVTERKTNQINFGYGLSSQEQFGFVKLTLLNFFEWGETITLRVQSGYELGREKQTYMFRYYTPWIFEHRRSFAYERYLKLRYENLIKDSVVVDTLEISRDGWDMELGIFERDPFYITTIYNEEKVVETIADPQVNYMKKSIALVNVYNTVKKDFYNNDAEGEYGRLRLEGGGVLGSLLGSEIDLGGRTYGRYELGYSRYLSLALGRITAVHFQTGMFNVEGSAPLLEGEQYTAGGSTTVRGYLDIYPFAVGTRQVIINAEYRHSFNEWFQGVLFYDWGNAFDLGPVAVSDFRSGYGLGVRFGTPLGPLRLDWGFGEDYVDIFGNEHTTARMPRNIIHFSLGQTF